MTKQKKKVLSIIAVIIIVVLVAVLLCLKSSFDKEHKQKIEGYLALYSEILHIDGDFTINKNNITCNNVTYDEKGLIQDVSLHNAFYSDEPITVEMLMEEFDSFCNDLEISPLIESYNDSMKAIRVRAENVEILVYSFDYEADISDYLMSMYNVDIARATAEQMEVASSLAAADIYNEVINREKND